MVLLKRATESTSAEWQNVPDGLWRWVVGEPQIVKSERYGNYRVKFPLTLTEAEQARLKEEHGDPPEGTNQSWRSSYSVGLSLGYYKAGVYISTKLVDFLCAVLGSKNQGKFRKYVAEGGGPEVDPTADDETQNQQIVAWLKWWEGMEVYGSIKNEADAEGRVWARFGGPLPVGSLPGQPEPDYQAAGLGKLRAMVAESGPPTPASMGVAEGAQVAQQAKAVANQAKVAAAVGATPRTYQDVFGDDED